METYRIHQVGQRPWIRGFSNSQKCTWLCLKIALICASHTCNMCEALQWAMSIAFNASVPILKQNLVKAPHITLEDSCANRFFWGGAVTCPRRFIYGNYIKTCFLRKMLKSWSPHVDMGKPRDIFQCHASTARPPVMATLYFCVLLHHARRKPVRHNAALWHAHTDHSAFTSRLPTILATGLQLAVSPIAWCISPI